MSYNADDHFPKVDRVFAPPMYSDEVLRAIRDHLGKNPTVALNEIKPEDLGIDAMSYSDHISTKTGKRETRQERFEGAFRSAREEVAAALGRFRDLDEMQESGQIEWVGTEAIAEAIDLWLERQRRRHELKKRQGSASHPELYSHDRRGSHWQGEGSDSGRVRRADVELFKGGEMPMDQTDFSADLYEGNGNGRAQAQAQDGPTDLIAGDNFWECPVAGCNEREKFNPNSDSSRNMARARISKHMSEATESPEDHRAARMSVFGS